jgi:hypothetical protein
MIEEDVILNVMFEYECGQGFLLASNNCAQRSTAGSFTMVDKKE